jgi:phosphopantothenate synthetase
MSSEFANVVEEVKKMPYEEKEELKFLIEKYLNEERREEIFQNYHDSLKELSAKKIKFSSDINQLKELIEE